MEVLERMKVFHRGERVVLVRDGLSAHWSRAMRAWAAEQDRPALERLPAYAPELNPVELPWSFLSHTGLTIRPPTKRTYEKFSSRQVLINLWWHGGARHSGRHPITGPR
ncbi:transposase [Streptomyces sp. NPDC058665]|uniref:transposase n=1 Tax=Streptomyces sp. NPDC058665 TaxID=3346586 RepID=UPI003661CF6F